MARARRQTLALAVLACVASAPVPAQETLEAAPPDRAGVHVERRITDLHRRLRITSAQEPAFETVVRAMRENAAKMAALFQARPDAVSRTAVDDIRAYAELARVHADGLARLVPAYEGLYEALSPEQRRTADATFREFRRREAERSARE